MRTLYTAACAIALMAFLPSDARAQNNFEYQKFTYVTFSGPVQVPGVTLPAGRYIFKMADIAAGDAHIVQVLSGNGKTMYAQFFAVPDIVASADTPRETVVLFAERPPDVPRAVRKWWYPNNPVGEEFVYPRQQAMMIAQANGTGVLTAQGRVGAAEETVTRTETTIAPPPQVAEAPPAPAPAPAPAPVEAPAPAAQAQAEPSTPAVGTSGSAESGAVGTSGQAEQLPRTSSELGLFGLLGGLSFAGAWGVRNLRSRAVAL